MTRFVPGYYAFETSPVGQKRTRVLSSVKIRRTAGVLYYYLVLQSGGVAKMMTTHANVEEIVSKYMNGIIKNSLVQRLFGVGAQWGLDLGGLGLQQCKPESCTECCFCTGPKGSMIRVR